MKNIRAYPTPISGLTLGLSGMAFFWSVVFPRYETVILIVGLIVTLLLLMPLMVKFICYPRLLWEDLKHPTVGSVVPTFAMTLMILAHTIQLWSLSGALIFWFGGIVIHFGFFGSFIFHQWRGFRFDKMLPSWFIPPVGMVVACLTVPTASVHWVALALLIFGMINYFVLLPLVLYRLFLHEKIEDARKPTLAILAAPPNLCLAGYLSVASHPDPLLTLILCSFALLMTASVYLMLFHLVRLPFSLGYAAFTFPLVIGGRAMYGLAHWMQARPDFLVYSTAFLYLAFFEAIIAVLMVIYVTGHYIEHLRALIYGPTFGGSTH